ncbi:hypothetical protein TSUD_63610 [Trifolium subterraneum]|uniref:Uncharacterized protein n=1 Tax=Trifolium subterraneum TaxID=3900 RepID=A0A2Z6N409_TRISU|nr:hypothetical protein TSUD_63610 [Trifolium subterraneum]
MQQVGWILPCEGWVALNTYGSKEAGSNYGCGGIIRAVGVSGLVDSPKVLEIVMWRWKRCRKFGRLKASVRFGPVSSRVVNGCTRLVKVLNKEVATHSGGWSFCKRIWRLLELD